MGNRASVGSPAPCFDDQIYSTLSWAEKKTVCRTLFDNSCQNVDESIAIVATRDDNETDHPPADSASRSMKTDDFPALTDNLSSSDPSDECRPSTKITLQNQQTVDVIVLHQEPQSTIPETADYYLSTNSSTEHTHGTSGSLERDARADLGTSRGSSGGREDFDEDSL